MRWLPRDGDTAADYLRADLLLALVLVPVFCLVVVAFGAGWSSTTAILLVWCLGGTIFAFVKYAFRRRHE